MGNEAYASITRLLTAAAALFVLARCGDSTSTGPSEPVDYVVYFQSSGTSDNLWLYHVVTGVFDSVPVQIPKDGNIAVSAHGALLYVTSGQQTRVLDTKSFSTVTTIPYGSQNQYGGVAVSPDDRWIAISGNGLVVLNTRDYSVLFQDTGTMLNGVASTDSRYFLAGVDQAGGHFVYRLDLGRESPVVTRRRFPQEVWKVVPSPDNHRWYVYSTPSPSQANLYVYDVAADSIVKTLGISPGYGDLQLSVDGRILFVCNPGNGLIGLPVVSAFFAYDTDTDSLVKVIETAPLLNQYGDTIYRQTNSSFAKTPDGRKLISLGGLWNNGNPAFIVCDIESLTIDKLIEVSRVARLNRVACQGRS
jgi:hypothetical protein